MKAFLLLGRLGDLTTVLPAVYAEHKATGQRVPVVVAKAFAGLLDGCSYAEPVVWDGPFERVIEAKGWAQRKLVQHQLIDCSVYGHGVNPSHDMWSFTREIWRLSKCSVPYEQAELVFDRRDEAREKAFFEATPARPFVLFAGAGTSSPFAEGPALLAALTEKLPDYAVVDISNVRAERPYDLLYLYERATALIATDSFPLHLAQAVPGLNTVALITDGPTTWHRSAWRPNHRLRVLYSEALRRIDDIVAAVREPKVPTLHFVTTQAANPDAVTKARLGRAHDSRTQEFRNGPWRTFGFAPERTAADIKDRPLPYVRDMIEQATSFASANDIIVLCNADIGFTDGLTGRVLEAVSRHGCAYAHRWDFYGAALSRRQPRYEGDLKQARWYAGSDFFAFSVAWWKKHGDLFPDMIWGREAWDMILRNLMKKTAGTEAEIQNAIWHERHNSEWERNGRLPGNEHNRRLAGLWLARHGGNWNDWTGPQKYRA